MTDKQAYICPLCDTQMESRIGIENHINGSTDDDHAGESGADHRADIERVTVDEPASTAPDRAESADGSGYDEPAGERGEPGSNPLVERGEPASTNRGEPASNPSCCNDPNLSGSRGQVVIGSNADPKRFAGKTRQPLIKLDRNLETPMKLSAGDRVCMNCDEIVEAADG